MKITDYHVLVTRNVYVFSIVEHSSYLSPRHLGIIPFRSPLFNRNFVSLIHPIHTRTI